MKKYKVLVALACVALLVVGSMGPGLAAKGAVKGDLLDGSGAIVGQVIVTPTGAGKVEVTVQVKDSTVTSAKSCTLYTGILAPWGQSPFKINAKGNGAGHVSYVIPAGTDTTVPQTILVSIWEPAWPLGTMLYSCITVQVMLK